MPNLNSFRSAILALCTLLSSVAGKVPINREMVGGGTSQLGDQGMATNGHLVNGETLGSGISLWLDEQRWPSVITTRCQQPVPRVQQALRGLTPWRRIGKGIPQSVLGLTAVIPVSKAGRVREAHCCA